MSSKSRGIIDTSPKVHFERFASQEVLQKPRQADNFRKYKIKLWTSCILDIQEKTRKQRSR